jgi:hypothetical protein
MFLDRTGLVRPKGGSASAVESFGSSFLVTVGCQPSVNARLILGSRSD